MIRLGSLIFVPPVYARLRARYVDYRRSGASWFAATLSCLWVGLAWIFLPLENARWQSLLTRHDELFPHINFSRPRPLDPLRFLLQAVWLIASKPPESRKPTKWRRYRASIVCAIAIFAGQMNCPFASIAKPATLTIKRSWRTSARKFAGWCLA